ncbi:hypothetical protein NB231_03852 [Nitrococcus mobilis Nb-231]|uniref:Uncharacterized protein n=1 Tax=Nitrococcus mobilis Nb-231 TaxID=314278 RepID=A4BTR5_9GAMM|nr:hypothetical protein NB231_03852 [Nitrococcus mobilis Nb-231]
MMRFGYSLRLDFGRRYLVSKALFRWHILIEKVWQNSLLTITRMWWNW